MTTVQQWKPRIVEREKKEAKHLMERYECVDKKTD